jgi:hypothetical protein
MGVRPAGFYALHAARLLPDSGAILSKEIYNKAIANLATDYVVPIAQSSHGHAAMRDGRQDPLESSLISLRKNGAGEGI